MPEFGSETGIRPGRTVSDGKDPRIAASILFSTFCIAFSSMILGAILPRVSHTKSSKEIDADVDEAVERVKKEVLGSDQFMKNAEGVLVFPTIIKAGIGLGGEYGERAMRIGGKTVEYRSTMAASIGFQLGAQARMVIIVFVQDEAQKKFRKSKGWKAGVDGSVALVTLGMGDSLDTTNLQGPTVGFIIGQKGLMYNPTLEDLKFSKISK